MVIEEKIQIKCPFCNNDMQETTDSIPKMLRGKKRYWSCITSCKTLVIKEVC